MKGRLKHVAKLVVFLFLEIASATPVFSNHHPDQPSTSMLDPPPVKRSQLTEDPNGWLFFFLTTICFIN